MIKQIFLGVVTALVLAGCGVAPVDGTRVLEDAGYTDVIIGGPEILFSGCGDGDTFKSSFTATSIATGRKVTGSLCQGWFKGITIRVN